MFAGLALLCWEICKIGEGLDGTEPAVHMLAVACARVHANGNNVIVLINRVLCGRRLRISA